MFVRMVGHVLTLLDPSTVNVHLVLMEKPAKKVRI